MQAGQLRHRVTIEIPTDTTDSGDVTVTWATFAERWARVEPLTGREFFQASQVHGDVTHQVTIRWMDGITAKMRIKHNGRYLYLLEPPRNVEEDREIRIEVLCREDEV